MFLWNLKLCIPINHEVFTPGSHNTAELKPGELLHFLASSGEGIYSDVAWYKENELLIIKHIGMLCVTLKKWTEKQQIDRKRIIKQSAYPSAKEKDLQSHRTY